MEFKFENKSIKNIDVMKKDLSNYIFGMNEDELYHFIGYLEHEDLKLPESVFTCERCAALNGNDCDIECCEKRFKKYCEEEHKNDNKLF